MITKTSFVFQCEFKVRFFDEQHYPANRIIKEGTTVID